jgi:hypothetical protein
MEHTHERQVYQVAAFTTIYAFTIVFRDGAGCLLLIGLLPGCGSTSYGLMTVSRGLGFLPSRVEWVGAAALVIARLVLKLCVRENRALLTHLTRRSSGAERTDGSGKQVGQSSASSSSAFSTTLQDCTFR